jgi:hypothetical protein
MEKERCKRRSDCMNDALLRSVPVDNLSREDAMADGLNAILGRILQGLYTHARVVGALFSLTPSMAQKRHSVV